MFKKLKLMFIYIKTIKNNIGLLRKTFVANKQNYIIKNIDYDKAYRVYTVLNFKEDIIDEFKKYGANIIKTELVAFIKEFNVVFKKLGIFEFVKISKVERIEKTSSVLVVAEYRLLSIGKIIKSTIIFSFLAILAILALIFI